MINIITLIVWISKFNSTIFASTSFLRCSFVAVFGEDDEEDSKSNSSVFTFKESIKYFLQNSIADSNSSTRTKTLY